MFELVGQGKIPEALEMVAQEVHWQSPVTRTGSKEMSWYEPRHSRMEVAEYFNELRDTVNPYKFEFSNFIYKVIM